MESLTISLLTKANDTCSYYCLIGKKYFELSASNPKITIEKPEENGTWHFSFGFLPFDKKNTLPAWLIVLSRLLFPEVPVEDTWPGKIHLFDFCYNVEIEDNVNDITIIVDNPSFDCEKINLFEAVPQEPTIAMADGNGITINGDLSLQISFEELKTNLWMSFHIMLLVSVIIAIVLLLTIVFTPCRTVPLIAIAILSLIDIYSLVVKWKQFKSIKEKLNDWYFNNKA